MTTASSARLRGRGLDLFVFAAAAAGFAAALRGGFVWDDWPIVAHTVGFRGFDARHLLWMLTTRHMTVYMPLPWLTYAVDFALWGLDPLGYHLTNVLLHAACAALFCGFSRRLLSASLPSAAPADVAFGAAAAALAFGLHPLRAESVAWISERRDVLAGVFTVLTLNLYWDAATGPSARRRGLLALSLAAYGCAAISKASVAPLPAVLLLLDVFPLRRLTPGKAPAPGVLAEKVPYFVFGAATAVMAVYAHASTRSLEALSSFGLGARGAQAVAGLGFYLSKTLVPVRLCALYPRDPGLGLFSGSVIAGAAVAAGCALALRLFVPEPRARLALTGSYVALILPVLGFLQNGPQAVALRYSYLSCMGWAVLFGAAAVRALAAARRGSPAGRAAVVGLALCLAVCAAALQGQLRQWRDDASLWSAVLALYPSSPDANVNMAEALLRAGDAAGAEACARRAAQAAPGERNPALMLAASLRRQGRLAPARDALAGAVAASPDWPEGQSMLGAILSELGADDEALPHLERAAALEPASALAQANAGTALARRGRFEEAAASFAAAARLAPDVPAYAQLRERARRDAGARR